MKLRKNIVSVTTDRDGKVTSETADYIGVKAFAKEIYNLYKECLDNFEDKDEFERYINDLFGSENYLMQQAYEFALGANEEMKEYLHRENHHIDCCFSDIDRDYPEYRTGSMWASEYDGDIRDFYNLVPDMIHRLDAAEDSERADDDRKFLSSWYFEMNGTYNITYNFSNDLQELHYCLEEEEVEEYVEA